jgi:hypothetical protein
MVGTAELKKLADSVEIIKMLCYILHLNGYCLIVFSFDPKLMHCQDVFPKNQQRTLIGG